MFFYKIKKCRKGMERIGVGLREKERNKNKTHLNTYADILYKNNKEM